MVRVRLSACALALAVLVPMLAVASPVSAAPDPPGFHLVRPTGSVTAYAYRNRIFTSLPVRFAAYGQGLEVAVGRRDYASPVEGTLSVVTTDGRTDLAIPSRMLNEFRGFHKALHITIRDSAGTVVERRVRSWCPNSYTRERVDPTGPATVHYPSTCSSHPFTRGMVWGVEQGWSTSLVEYLQFRGTDDRYEVTVKLDGEIASLLGVPKGERTATIRVDVQREQFVDDGGRIIADGSMPAADSDDDSASPRHSPVPRPHPPVASGAPDPATLPDLVSLPAYGISVTSTRSGKDRLAFAANEWNAGPAPMVVVGFRRGTRPTMDAYQVLYDATGEPVEYRPTGTMEFHDAPQHDHWHFLDFARYDLVDADGEVVGTSGKQSWCLAPTDPIDLRVPGAVFGPEATGLTSTCGGPEAMWIRETMPVGWGDTYVQYQTQAIDITDVPNGTYWLRITVNPRGRLFEASTANNVSRRKVILGGTAGARTTRVPPFRSIDTEGVLTDQEPPVVPVG